MLIVFGGLPGVGKTTVARELAAVIGAMHVRIDSIEQALRDAGLTVEGEGYGAAYAIAADNLRPDHHVVADCVNPWPLTRNEWAAVASRAGVRALNVEIVCSDITEHKRRSSHGRGTSQGIACRHGRKCSRATIVPGTANASSSTPRDSTYRKACG